MGKIWDKLTEIKPDPIALARRNTMTNEIGARAVAIVDIVGSANDKDVIAAVESQLQGLWEVAQDEAKQPQMRHI